MPDSDEIRRQLLFEVDLFRNMNQPQLDQIVPLLHMHRYEAEEVIFYQGDPGDSLYIVVSGTVRIQLHDQADRSVIFREYRRGDVFGEFAVLDGKARTATAVAHGAVTVFTIYRHEFFRLLRTDFELVQRLFESLVERLRFTTSFSEDMAFLTATQRLARALAYLARHAARRNGQIELNITHDGLAAYIGVSREWVNKALNQAFAPRGMIRSDRGVVVVLKLERLLQWAATPQLMPRTLEEQAEDDSEAERSLFKPRLQERRPRKAKMNA